ncbi:Pc12g02200 [Penicillium rubens Wisconsin 54-1255]|uniref:Pc12g02200 protein n=2 Tax=Penicillium chrysogenum species complex TaxID=254878 RepID=B6GZM7_PENRW|nr:Pc12g02200 [Penicillium rubens Wisconsin 54-1255]
MTESPAHVSGSRQPSGVILRNARPRDNDNDNDNDNDMDPREALELQQIQTQEDNELNYSTASASSGDEYRVVTRRTTSRADAQRRQQARKGTWGKLTQLWTHNVTLTVPHKSSRDYFALERTFLAYIRTSLVVAQQGVLIAQLFRLQAAEALADRLGFRRVGTPLSVACHCVAILVALVGAYRFWRQQNAIARGKVFAGGWELNSVGILLGCITLTVLIVSIAMVVETDTDTWAFVRRILGRVFPAAAFMRALRVRLSE